MTKKDQTIAAKGTLMVFLPGDVLPFKNCQEKQTNKQTLF